MIWYDMNWYDMSYDPLLSKHTYETRFWRYVPRSKFFIYHWFHREKPGAFLIQFLPTLLDRQRDFVLDLSCTTQLNVVNNKKKGFGWIRNHWNQDFGISVLCVVCPQTETGSFRFFWQGWIRKISDDWDCTKVPSHKRCDEPIYLVHAKQDSGDSCNKLAQFLSHCLLQSNDTSDLCQGFHMGMGQN